MHRALSLALALALLALAPAPARAAYDDEDDQLFLLNQRLQECIARLPKAIGETPTSDATAIADIKATLDKVKPKMSRYRSDDRYQLVVDNVANLEGELVSFQTGSVVFALINEINSAHVAGKPVPQARVDALLAAQAQFEKVVNDRWRPVAQGYARIAATLRQQNADILKSQADFEAAQARAAADARRAVVSEQARKGLDRLYFLLKAGDRLPAADLATLKAQADELDTIVAGSGRFYRRELVRLAGIALWDKPDDEALAAIAGVHKATLVAKGRASGKLQVSFEAAADWCYVVTGRFVKNSGADRVLDFAWSAKAGRSALQAFELMEERGEGLERGFCATQATKVGAAGKVESVGKGNALRWAVLGWERSKFPADLATRLALEPFDHCDVAFWKSLWLQPVPGTLAWKGQEPFLLLGEEGNGLDLNGARMMLPLEKLVSRPPAQAKFATAPHFVPCARRGQPAWTPDSKAVLACVAPLDKKYQALRSQAWRGKGPQVTENAAKVERQYDEETAKKCGKAEEKIAPAMAALFAEVTAAYAARIPADSTDRLGVLQARMGVRGPEASAAK